MPIEMTATEVQARIEGLKKKKRDRKYDKAMDDFWRPILARSYEIAKSHGLVP